MEKQRIKKLFSNINIASDRFSKCTRGHATSSSSLQSMEPLVKNISGPEDSKTKNKNIQRVCKRRLNFDEVPSTIFTTLSSINKEEEPVPFHNYPLQATSPETYTPSAMINKDNFQAASTFMSGLQDTLVANKIEGNLAEDVIAISPPKCTPSVNQITTNLLQVYTAVSPHTDTPAEMQIIDLQLGKQASSSPLRDTRPVNSINASIPRASFDSALLKDKLFVNQIDQDESQVSATISLGQRPTPVTQGNESIPQASLPASPLKNNPLLNQINLNAQIASTTISIDITKLSANAEKLMSIASVSNEQSQLRNIDDHLRLASASTLYQNDANSDSNLTSRANPKSLRVNRKTYEISPINSGESDPDLSGTDPTYNRNRKSCDRNVPSRLLTRSRSSSSSSGSSSSSSSVNTNSDSTEEEDKTPGRKSRKRKRDPENWRDNCAKRKRNSGQSYVSVRTKKLVPARSIKPPCTQKCRLKCHVNIDEQNRKTMFDKFWRLEDIALQRAFIKTCMIEVKPKYKYSQTANPRKANSAFYLKIGDKKQRVCKTFFINTFDISDRMLRTIKEKCDENDFMTEDRRGKHGNHKKLSESLVRDIMDFIEAIPRVESHYIRATSSCEYIYPGRTLTDIYQDFVEIQRQNNRPSGKFCNFYEIFKDSGIKIHQPKKDLCDLCTKYKLSPSDDLKEEYEKHQKEKKLSREEKRNDRYAIDENNVCAIFDLEAILPVPCGSSSGFYYKSKINCYNFTISELAKMSITEEESHKAYTEVHCYFWDETQGQKGSTEIGTCVYNFLKLINDRTTSESVNVIFYSDNCCGQNKNKYITALYMFALQRFPKISSITHKFLIKGHTQNENDNAHSLIEKNVQKYLKAEPIYIPPQYITLIQSAKKTGKKFQVQALTYEDFIDVKKLQSEWGPNFSKNVDRNQVSWNDIKLLQFRKGEPSQFYYKTSYGDALFQEVNVRAGIRRTLPMVEEVILGKAYNQKFEIDSKKKIDLKSLITSKVIPPYFANYYNDII